MDRFKQEKPKTSDQRRFRVFIIITAVFIGLLIWQYISLMLTHAKPAATSTLTKPLVERGPILDRNGRILAIQTRLSSVTAWIPHIDNPQETARILSRILGLDEETLINDFKTRNGFMYIKRKISPTDSKLIQDEKSRGRLNGISLEPEYGRNYPEKHIASHVLGYVGTDNTGLSGLEYTFDHELSPTPKETSNEVIFGNQLFLTIDLNLEYFADEIARKAYEEYDASFVMLLVMEAKTGDILAYVAKPDFDPNLFANFSVKARQNPPVDFAYEPGSVFKIFSLSSILELKGVTPEDKFLCTGSYTIRIPNQPNEYITCLRPHGEVTPQKIIQYSCNVGMANASETVGREEFYGMLRDFGFGTPTGLPFSGETHGQLRPPSQWSLRSKPTIAFGQEIGVSAVQILSAATVFTNDGVLLRPHIVKKILAPDGSVIQEFHREPVREVISPKTAREILDMMETATFPGGTARRIFIDGLRISAKTGTAQQFDKKTGKYSDNAYLASAIAIFPTEDPQFITYAVINHPKGNEYYGSEIAIPMLKEMIEDMIPYYGIPREGDVIVHHPGTVDLHNAPPLTIGKAIPDFTGLSKRELLPLFKIDNITVRIHGEGWVARQDPPPGTPVTSGMTINLELK